MNDENTDSFGTLRSLLQGQPSPEAWRELWELLGKLEGHERERAFAYVARPLDRWPDALRTFGRSTIWEKSLDRGFYAICRTLDLSNTRDTLRWFTDEKPEAALTYDHDFSRITRFDLSSSLEPLGVVAKYMKNTHMNAVREVDLSRSKRSQGETTDDLDAFADVLDAQPGTVSIDLTKTSWVHDFRLSRLLERAGGTIDTLVLSQAKQDGNTLGALEKARGGALRTLDLSRNRIWNRHGLDVLLKSKILTQLHTLDLSRNDLNGRTLGPLVAAVAPTVRHLGLTEVREPSFLRDQLAKHPLPGLTRLALDTEGFSSRLDPVGVRELTLAYSGCGACDLPKHPIFGRLTSLTLWRADDPEFVTDLLARADLSELRGLTLEDTPTHGSVLEALVDNPTAQNIERLHILNPGFDGASGRGLARLLELPSLSELRITRLPDYDAKYTEELLNSPLLSRLGELALLDCVLSDALVEQLFRNPALERLELLRLRLVGKLSKDTVEFLTDPPYLPRHWRPSKHIAERRAAKRHFARLAAQAEAKAKTPE